MKPINRYSLILDPDTEQGTRYESPLSMTDAEAKRLVAVLKKQAAKIRARREAEIKTLEERKAAYDLAIEGRKTE